jgi:hypothetical protein
MSLATRTDTQSPALHGADSHAPRLRTLRTLPLLQIGLKKPRFAGLFARAL